ncbi:MAG: transcriptional repressor [Muribaculaceae bacterium]|nr:transcriptional repressor [Muribaculaceae bacterium]
MSDITDIEIHKKRFTDFLVSKRMRKTPERFEILNCALNCNGHFDADLLYNLLEANGYHVSKATVYSTLELLSEAGVVRKLLFDTHQARYEIADESHSHLICTVCGEITEIAPPGFEVKSCADMLNGFHPSYISTCIYGICRKCQMKKKDRK